MKSGRIAEILLKRNKYFSNEIIIINFRKWKNVVANRTKGIDAVHNNAIVRVVKKTRNVLLAKFGLIKIATIIVMYNKMLDFDIKNLLLYERKITYRPVRPRKGISK